jgi:hypothetical protein
MAYDLAPSSSECDRCYIHKLFWAALGQPILLLI